MKFHNFLNRLLVLTGIIMLCFAMSACGAEDETNVLAEVPETVIEDVPEEKPEPIASEIPVVIPTNITTDFFTLTEQQYIGVSPAYVRIIEELPEEAAYAVIKTDVRSVNILLVTEGVFHGAAAENAALYCEVYFEIDGIAKSLGCIEAAGGMGTAYPICYADDGIYAAMHHDIARFVISKESQDLVMLEFAKEIITTGGEETFTYILDGQAIEVPDRTQMIMMFENYEQTKEINFIRKTDMPLYLQEHLHQTGIAPEDIPFALDEMTPINRAVKMAVEGTFKDYPQNFTGNDIVPLLRRFEILKLGEDILNDMVVYIGLVSGYGDLAMEENRLYVIAAYHNNEILDIVTFNEQTGKIITVDHDIIRSLTYYPIYSDYRMIYGYVTDFDAESGTFNLKRMEYISNDWTGFERLAELGYTDEDMPGGFVVHDPQEDAKTYKFTEQTRFCRFILMNQQYQYHSGPREYPVELTANEFAETDYEGILFAIDFYGEEIVGIWQQYLP